MPRNLDLPLIGIVAAALVVALVVALVATPVVKNLAIRVKAVDVPKDGRRMHDHPIPRMGGLAIFLGFLLSVLLFLDLNAQMRGMLLGAVIIVVLGIFDDIYSLRAMFKFVVQIIAGGGALGQRDRDAVQPQRVFRGSLLESGDSGGARHGHLDRGHHQRRQPD